MASRYVFQSTPCNLQVDHQHLQSKHEDLSWVPVISCPADFSFELFEVALLQLIHHPEYNSTLILRSETIQEKISDLPDFIPELHGLVVLRNVHRRLLARRPGRDAALEQHCTLYGSPLGGDWLQNHPSPSTLVLTPVLDSSGFLPYYHPTVFHIAFRYIANEGAGQDSPTSRLQIEVVPFPNTPLDPNSRLYRTCLSLLETLHRYGWGAANDYKKRVQHDLLVTREEYQDTYLIMRERHKHLVDTWHESTDPLKHVFEDIGIATYLMLLWKVTFEGSPPHISKDQEENSDNGSPWRSWPRPPGGFVDLGCGNGLLVHILISEGYAGYGTDVRARISWSHYPESTKQNLHISPLDPVADTPPAFPPGAFIIGNHADELTPWVPIVATTCNASGYLNLPCCPWEFDQKYTRSGMLQFPLPSSDFVDTLNLGGDGRNTSSYSMYRIWLARLSFHFGWKVEAEVLRIPSTRNWALVGRTKHIDDVISRARADEIIVRVRERGIFSTRTPEGKSKDH